MKKIIFSFALVSSIVLLNSCLKDKAFDNNDYGLKASELNKTPIVQFLSGGLDKLSNQKIEPDVSKLRDTTYFQVFYVNNGLPAAQDVTVKFGISATALAAFNAIPSRADFDRLPDSTFIFTATSAVVKAGQSLSEPIPFIYFPTKIDPSKLYMVAISISDGGAGNIISSNNSNYYVHIIGNPLAGDYSVLGTRYNCSATGDQNYAGGPIPANFAPAAIPTTKTLGAVSATVTSTYVANLGAGTARDYFFDIDNSVTTLQNIGVDFTPSFANGISNIRFLTKTFDPVTKKITLLWTYNNQLAAAGNDRIISEVLTKL
jgi:Domain of unknown function (DUF1735)